MPRLMRMLRLFAVTVLVIAGTCAVLPNAAAADKPRDGEPPRGFDQKTLVEVCDHYQGKYLEDLPSPYRYGCLLSDGQISCQETTECTFFRTNDGLPFEESCERAGDTYLVDKLDVFRCWNRPRHIVLHCDPRWEVCSIGHDQPIP